MTVMIALIGLSVTGIPFLALMGGVAALIGIPLFFLAGVAWPIEMLPQWMQRVALAVPSTLAIPSMVRVNQMGASWQDVLSQVAMLWGLTALYGIVAFTGLSLARERPKLPGQATEER